MRKPLVQWRAILNRRSVRLLIAALALGIILAKVDRAVLTQHLHNFDPVCGLAMVGIFLAILGLFGLRWWIIAAALGIRAPFRQFVRVLWISQVLGEVGPPLIMGELARFQFMRGHGEVWRLVASQAVDRFSDRTVLLALVLGLLPFYLKVYQDSPLLRIGAYALMLGGVAGLGGLMFWRFWPITEGQGGGLWRVCNPLRAPQHYGFSLLIQVLLATNLALAALGLGRDAWTVLLLGPLLLLGVGSLPGLVSDWGKREATAVILLGPAGFTPEQSLAVSLIYGALNLATALPGALLWMRTPRA